MPPVAFRRLRELRKNNNRAWMREHGHRVRMQTVEPFADVLIAASFALADRKIELHGGPDTVFRMQRDLRFTSDKTPYRPWVEGILTPDEFQVGSRAGIHLRCALDGGFLRAGSFLLPAAGTLAVRTAMVEHRKWFLGVTRDLEGKGFGLVSDDHLARGPRGFEAERDGPLGPYLRMKSPVAEARLKQADWCDIDLVRRIVAFGLAVEPWLDFLTFALDGVPEEDLRPARPPASPDRRNGR